MAVQTALSTQCDVLIVGGGIAGASLGARLAGEMSVILIEAEDLCGRHSTGRSAAFWLRPTTSSNSAMRPVVSVPGAVMP